MLNQFIKALLVCLSVILPTSILADTPEEKTVLIINSYGQNAPWTKSLMIPITMRLSQIPEVHCETYHMNNTLITDSASMNLVRDNLFQAYAEKKPDYLVLLGKMAFLLREDIKKNWGDIPILLIARSPLIGDLNYYLSGANRPSESSKLNTLETLRKDYNFTTVIVPQFAQPTVELMLSLMPDMHKLVFASDVTFLNRNVASNIKDYLIEEYPGIKYEWLTASDKNAEKLQMYLGVRDPQLGILMSNWNYNRPGPFGYPILSSAELGLISSSANPVFSLNDAFLELGALGGAFPNTMEAEQQISIIFEDMLAGKSMREIPFYMGTNKYIVTINYSMLKKFGLDPDKCPEDTVFLNRPQTFWEKYHWEVIGMIVLLVIAILAIWKRNSFQHSQIAMLHRHKEFVDKMPIPYSKAIVCFNPQGKVTNINYTLKNEAFVRLIEENSIAENPFLLFPADLIARKTTQLLEEQRDVRFLYTFEKTGLTYDFMLSLVSENNEHDEHRHVREIDVFALDITQRIALEEEMKEIATQLDLTINVANIIPWEWNMKTDVLKFDAYTLFDRPLLTTTDMSQRQSTLDATEFINLVYEKDQPKMKKLREGMLTDSQKSAKMRYRIKLARDGQTVYEWVEIRARVTERDHRGNPAKVAGAMWRLDESDVPESERT